MTFKVRSGRKEIVLPPDVVTAAEVRPRRPLVVALTRTYKWQQMIDTGDVASLAELAERHDVDRSYVSRIINLAGLAPDIVQAILAGNEPNGLSLRKLMTEGIPVRWDQQREVLGF